MRILIGTRKGLFTAEPGKGGEWRISDTAFLGAPVSMVLDDDRSGLLYAALDHGHFGVKLHRSGDRGSDWEEIAAPKYPPKPEGVKDEDPMRHLEIPWDLKLIWSLETGTPDQEGRVWCGTMPGGLFRSDDHGDSWQLVDTLWHHQGRSKWFGGGADLPGIHSIAVHPSQPERVTIAVSCGGIWQSDDSGNSWENRGHGMWAAYLPPDQARDPGIQDPHRLVQCTLAPDIMWAQHHNGIFVSEDCGANWNEIHNVSPSTFGFTIAVHPRDPQTAWVVPARKDEERIPVDGKLVVARTRNGGDDWQTLRSGLPQEHAYDIVFRHALAVSPDGEQLAIGSTTGSIWVSEDQGDTWNLLSAHLPPVYCLRFAA